MARYENSVLGDPSSEQLRDLERGLQEAADAFQLSFGVDLILQTNPAQFAPPQRTTAVAVNFGGPGGGAKTILGVLAPANVTIIPVASAEDLVTEEIPADLKSEVHTHNFKSQMRKPYGFFSLINKQTHR